MSHVVPDFGDAGLKEPPTVAVIVMGFPGQAAVGLMVTVTGSPAGAGWAVVLAVGSGWSCASVLAPAFAPALAADGELLASSELPQADSARAREAASSGVASNASRPLVLRVRSMPS